VPDIPYDTELTLADLGLCKPIKYTPEANYLTINISFQSRDTEQSNVNNKHWADHWQCFESDHTATLDSLTAHTQHTQSPTALGRTLSVQFDEIYKSAVIVE